MSPEKSLTSAVVLVCLFISSSTSEASTFYVTNKCPFPIWPAAAPNQGHPVVANGGFYLPPGMTQIIPTPGNWTGRIWARTGCNFTKPDQSPACQTGDCNGKLECNGTIGTPPVTLVEAVLHADKKKPSFYDVSLVDGYNLPIHVFAKSTDKKCHIEGCLKDVNSMCPLELQVVGIGGEVTACKSACLAFGLDFFCCTKDHDTPDKCKPNVYSNMFKEACPSYVSYAFDTQLPVISCVVKEFIVTFCPEKWGGDYLDV